jgi:hypothetical protein
MCIEGGSILRKDYAMAEDQFPTNVAILDDYQNVASNWPTGPASRADFA